MTKRIHHSIILLLSCLFFMQCSKNDETTHEDHHEEESDHIELSAAQYKNVGIVTGKVERKQISGVIRVNGVLDVPPQQLVTVSAPLGGFLKNTDLLEGSRVKKGEVVATIENLEFLQIQQDYLEAKGQFEFTKADYERQEELAKENVNSQKTLQQARSNFTSWQGKYYGLREKLKLLNIDPSTAEQGKFTSTIRIYSPINGYVTRVNVNIGKFVNPSDMLFEIVDTQHLHAELIVFEKDVSKLKIGQKVRFTLANETQERIAEVYLIGRAINDDRTIQIHCHIEKEDKELLPGMFLNALVETGGAEVPALPSEAIVDYMGKKYIFVVSDAVSKDSSADPLHTFEILEVQVGNSEFGHTELTPPTEELLDKEIVLKGAYELLSKMKNQEEEGGHAH